MATTNTAKVVNAAAEAIQEHFSPTLEVLGENVRQARRAVAHGTQAAEGAAEATAKEVRRHPLRAAAIAAGVAVLAGGVIGFAFGRGVQR
jgi:ElaB/YqjD/DUF883 family membrane-anchored ribosome-binding protein